MSKSCNQGSTRNATTKTSNHHLIRILEEVLTMIQQSYTPSGGAFRKRGLRTSYLPDWFRHSRNWFWTGLDVSESFICCWTVGVVWQVTGFGVKGVWWGLFDRFLKLCPAAVWVFVYWWGYVAVRFAFGKATYLGVNCVILVMGVAFSHLVNLPAGHLSSSIHKTLTAAALL